MVFRAIALLAFSFLFAVSAASASSDGGVPARERILLVPLGKPARSLVGSVRDALVQMYAHDVSTRARVALPREAWYRPRRRWRAEKLLHFLERFASPGTRVLGITDAPISTTKGKVHDWGIAGLGTLDGKSAVLTSHLFRRFKRRPKTYRKFVDNLVLHEVGHMLGVDHCGDERCIMADAKGNAVRAALRSTNRFCASCRARLQRWLRNE
jgi:archaemetzincin